MQAHEAEQKVNELQSQQDGSHGMNLCAKFVGGKYNGCITCMTVTPSYEKGTNGTDVDVCVYDITYAPSKEIAYKYYVSPSW